MNNTKKLIIISVICVLAVITTIFLLTRSPNMIYQFDTVQKKNLTEKVNIGAKIVSANNVDLSFPISGRVNKTYVQVGDRVKTNQILLSLDNADLSAQYAQAQANLDKQMAGPTPEYITQLQANLDKAKTDLAQIQGTTLDAESSKLVQNAYDDMMSNLQIAQINLSDSLTAADNILGIDNTFANDNFEIYLSARNPSQLNTAKDNYSKAKEAKNYFDNVYNKLNPDSDHKNIDDAVEKFKITSSLMKDTLFDISTALDNAFPANNFSQSNLDALKAGIRTSRSNLAAKYASVISQSHVIETARNNYASYQTVVEKAEAALKDALNPPRSVDVAAAKAQVALAAANYNKTILYSPIEGVITKQDAKIGSVISPGIPIVSIINDKKYQAEGYISQIDYSKVKIGDKATITLDNLGTNIPFDATVIKIDPAGQQLADGSIAYKVTLQLENDDSRISAGLTANANIITSIKENVLAVPEKDIIKKDGKMFTILRNNKNNQEKEVIVGIKSADGFYEITSGLEEGNIITSYGNNNK